MILPEDQGWQFFLLNQSKGRKMSLYFLFTRISIFRSLRLAGIVARAQEKFRSLSLARPVSSSLPLAVAFASGSKRVSNTKILFQRSPSVTVALNPYESSLQHGIDWSAEFLSSKSDGNSAWVEALKSVYRPTLYTPRKLCHADSLDVETDSLCLSVRMTVCPSRCGIVSKRMYNRQGFRPFLCQPPEKFEGDPRRSGWLKVKYF